MCITTYLGFTRITVNEVDNGRAELQADPL